jgi:histidine-specific SAM-dependent methyltransferase/TIR domain-containing protein
MAQIFISHSARDEGLVDKFHDLLQTGLGIHATDTIFISSVPGRDVSMGNVHEHIASQLVDAQLVIFVISPNFLESRYCWAEVGAAFASDRNTLLLTVPPTTKDDVTVMFEGYQVEQLATKKALNKLHGIVNKLGIERSDQGPERWEPKRDEFIEWFKSGYEAAASTNGRVEELSEWRDRGHWSKSIVDGTIYVGHGYANMDVKEEIFRGVKRGHVLDTIYAYLTNAGYHNWLRLTGDPTYKYYDDSISLISDNAEALSEKVREAVGRDEIDLISLGPGDGRKDVALLKGLVKKDFKAADLYYYPFDVNASMISHAMTSTRGVRPTLKDIQVKAILADFDSLPEFSGIYQYRDAPNVLSLLGNTLGNLPEDRGFLEKQVYGRAMSPGDLLLLEVRRISDSSLLTEANKVFDFGPLELLGIEFDPEMLHYEPTNRYRNVPNSDITLAIYEKVLYEEEEFEDVELALIREYDPVALEEVCEDIGFKVLSREKNRSAAYLLLQK